MNAAHPRSAESGAVLPTAVVFCVLVLLYVAAVVTTAQLDARSAREAADELASEVAAESALHLAFHEIGRREDVTGSGLGALGILEPYPLFDAAGRKVGEARVVVRRTGATGTILAVAATPSFGAPSGVRRLAALEGLVEERPELLLDPAAGALSLAGTTRSPPEIKVANADRFLLDGGTEPALSARTEAGFTTLFQAVAQVIRDGTVTTSALRGSPLRSATDSTGATLELPIGVRPKAPPTAAALDAYRAALRDGATRLAQDASAQTISTPLLTNTVYGSPESPAVVVVDSTALLGLSPFQGPSQRIEGHGTLILLGGTELRENVSLVWHGDVIVVETAEGVAAGAGLRFAGARATIDGSLTVLGADGVGASLEVHGPSVPAGGTPGAKVTVRGAATVLADAASGDARVSVAERSELRVEGMLAAHGSRLRVDTADSPLETGADDLAALDVRGALSLGLPADGTREDDLALSCGGRMELRHDALRLESARGALAALETQLGAGAAGATVRLRMYGGRRIGVPTTALADLEALVRARGGPRTAQVGWDAPVAPPEGAAETR